MQQDLFPPGPENTYARLVEAERKAALLFEEAENRQLICPGKTEKMLNKALYALAFEMFGVKKHWHKRIVRAGKNTLSPYSENPPDLVLRDDEILFFDFGPIFDAYEADFGRTYVIGNDARKLRLRDDVAIVWQACFSWFHAQEKNVSGADLYHRAVAEAENRGWSFGAGIAGHLVGKFPHEKLDPRQRDNYICAANAQNMFLPDKSGNKRYWILEIHLVDREYEAGAFFEQLLSVE